MAANPSAFGDFQVGRQNRPAFFQDRRGNHHRGRGRGFSGNNSKRPRVEVQGGDDVSSYIKQSFLDNPWAHLERANGLLESTSILSLVFERKSRELNNATLSVEQSTQTEAPADDNNVELDDLQTPSPVDSPTHQQIESTTPDSSLL